MKVPIWYEYDKITDDLMFLGNGGMIQMVVHYQIKIKMEFEPVFIMNMLIVKMVKD